jgi:hypothetical protein
VKFGHRPHRPLAFLLAAFAALTPRASSQALYTATQQYSLSAWGGATGTFVNLPLNNSGIPVVTNGGPFDSLFTGGKNVGISAGVDLRVWHYHGFLPSVEIRGTYPIANGKGAAEENALAGIKIEYPLARRYHLYGDFLFGRAELKYQGSGYPSPDGSLLYQQTYSNVLSPGLGVDIDVNHHFAVKLDAQLWHISVPVTASGTLNSLAGTAGVIYRFDFNHPPKVPRDTRPR